MGIEEWLTSETSSRIDWDEIRRRTLDRELLFVSDKRTYQLIRDEEFNEQEFAVLRKYLDDRDARILVASGLVLRDLQNVDQKRLESLREDIRRKYDAWGLHVAQAAQAGFLWHVASRLVGEDLTNQAMTEQFTQFVREIDRHMAFVRKDRTQDGLVREIEIQLSANKPNIYAVAGRGKAVDIADEVAAQIERERADYDHVTQERDESGVVHIFRLDEVFL